MSQDQDPIGETRRFEPVDPYNIPAQGAGAPPPGYEDYQPEFEQQPYGAPQQPKPGFKQRLTRLGPLKLAVLGTAGVIVLGGAAWGTTAALSSSGSSSNAAVGAPAVSQAPGAGATTGGTGKHKGGKLARVKITQLGSGSFTGTEGKGNPVTVDYGAKTRFGTKARALTSADLRIGMTVTVLGPLQGDTIDATAIAVPAKTAKNPDQPGASSSPAGGAA